MSAAFDPWAALAEIRGGRLGGLGADEAPAAAGEARFSAGLGGLGGLGARRSAESNSAPPPPAEHDAAEAAAPPSARPYLPGDPDPLRDGLLLASLTRPPAWGDATPPPAGAWCSCCGRHAPEAGGRWWSPRNPRSDGLALGAGWRCWTCHPPPPGCAVVEAQT
jgi:hypothetical protein